MSRSCSKEEHRADHVLVRATRPSESAAARRASSGSSAMRAHAGAHHRRRDPVHADAARRELARVLAHEHGEPALGRAIRRVATAAQPQLRAHRRRCTCLPPCRWRFATACARNIAALRFVSSTSSHASSVTLSSASSRCTPGAVHQDVDALDRFQRLFDSYGIAHIHRDSLTADLCKRGCLTGIAAGDDDLRALGGEAAARSPRRGRRSLRGRMRLFP